MFRKDLARLLPWVLPVVCAGLTLFAWHQASQEARGNAETEIEFAADETAEQIRGRMLRYEQILLGASSLFASSDVVTREEWYMYYGALQLQQRSPGVQGLGYTAIVPPGERASFSEAMRKQYYPDFEMKPKGERAEYSSIIYLAPLDDRNKRAIGFDMLSETTRRSAMLAARDSGQPTLSGKVKLVQETTADLQAGCLLYVAVYDRRVPQANMEDRRGAIRGYVYSPFRAKDLMLGILSKATLEQLRVEVFDGASTDAKALMFDSLAGRNLPRTSLSATRELSISDHRWTLRVTAMPTYGASLQSRLPEFIAGAGTLLTLMLLALIFSQRNRDLRARKLALAMTAELREAGDRFQRVVDATPCGILICDETGTISFSNAEAARMFGYDTLIGTLIDELVPASTRGIHRGLRAGFAAMSDKPGRRMAAGRRVSGLRRDGGLLPIEIGLNTLQAEGQTVIIAAVQDVSERNVAEARASAAQQLLRSVIDAAADFSIIATDADGIVTLFNRGAEQMLGYGAAEFVGVQSPAILHDAAEVAARSAELTSACGEPVEGFEVFVRVARAQRSETREWSYMTREGKRIPVNLTVSALRNDASEVIGFLGVAYDITSRKRFEQDIQQARKNAEAASVAKGDFLANMSHEIRTPLNAVLGMAQLLSFTDLKPEQREQVELISASGKSLLGILNDILDFSKIEAGRMTLDESEFELGPLVYTLRNMMVVNAAQKSLKVTCSVAPDVPAKLVSDSLRLQQVLINLMGNAIKFTQKGEVSLHIRVEERSEDSVLLHCAVNDSGIGLTEEQIGRLFTAFSQADTSTTRRYGGSGLGLAICKRIVNLMGGEIGALSEPGKGSSFWFTFRARLASDAAALGDLFFDDAAPEVSTENCLSGLRILLVEDNTLNQRVALGLLKPSGARIEVANNGQEAVDTLHNRARDFDVVLMDVQMPVLDGLAATRLIRRELGLSLPIIALTAGVIHSERQECFDAGMNDFLRKPLELDTCLRVLRSYLPGPTTTTECTAMTPPVRPVEHAAPPQIQAAGNALDIEGTITRLGGDRALYFELLQFFVEETPGFGAEATGLLEAARWRDLKRAFHTLKSTAGNIGAEALSNLVRDAEHQVQAENAATASDAITRVQVSIDNTCEQIRTLLATPH